MKAAVDRDATSPSATGIAQPTRPVCVDVDGTLIAGDVLWESFATLARQRPLTALRVLLTLTRGRAHFKQCVAEHVTVDPTSLLYREELLEELRELNRRGVPLVLATAGDRGPAQAIADHLQIFSEVIASDGRSNLKGQRKADALIERFGNGGFDYIGNDWADLPIWRVAASATIVAAPSRLVKQLASEHSTSPRVIAPRRRSTWWAFITALRPHQWVKNALVFVPVIAGHQLFRLDMVAASVLTFVAFSLSASAIYLLNDISDVAADRLHQRKRRRAFASGEVGIPVGVFASLVLLTASLLVAGFGVSTWLVAVVVAYVVTTTAYSLRLKRKPVVDIFTLTGLYLIRIVAGGVAAGIQLTTWLLAFALFLFLSLAFVKRYTELLGTKKYLPGREYGPEDGMWMQSIGTSAGYMAVLVLALYVSSPEVTALYSRPDVLWLLCPLLLFWVTRLWFRAGRGLVHDDPVVDALRDRFGYLLMVTAAVIFVLAGM